MFGFHKKKRIVRIPVTEYEYTPGACSFPDGRVQQWNTVIKMIILN